ncbi:helicase [Nostoc sp. C057]|uniref:DEAD/DEAH box helicase family protein n=1 Tax=Nostoc sp. C057 TaxID=2576903 RepID=UPI0015C3E63D|nr:DEAD/DEAH box helicase family protein [Nostoc sp. C057]QLE47093.1 helicase [Nostoc sp. C057]
MDFSTIKRPGKNPKPIHPIEIFEKLPNLPGSPNDLWRGQTEALNQWHEKRNQSDVLIALNTGAGKTLAGLLIAQSLVNEGIDNIIYLCATIDLVYQTKLEAEEIGIKCTTRVKGDFDTDLFETGKAFCITTYSSMFNGLSIIQRDYFPGAIIFDDAHVAEKIIRESFTLKIDAREHSDIYSAITDLFETSFKEIGKYGSLKEITSGASNFILMATPSSVIDNAEGLFNILVNHKANTNKGLKFAFNHLKDNLIHCAIHFSSQSVEIAPPFLPIFAIPVFERPEIRRIYLSATLNYKSDIARTFGRIPECVEPKNDAGNGERLILFASEIPEKRIDDELVGCLVKKYKILLAVPSYKQAESWNKVGKPPDKENFSNKLQEFRQASSGIFILVSRVDGIDLPHDTCRVMIIDELPTGSSLLEQYLSDTLNMKNIHAARIGNRITQLFGRINRGRNDYGLFIINGRDLNNWLKKDRNLALLPDLLSKQIRLGLFLHEEKRFNSASEFIQVADTVLRRDKGWIEFYGEGVENMEIDEKAVQKTTEIEVRMTQAALAEVKFMSAMWARDYVNARVAIEQVIEETQRADTKLAGWHNVWIGMCLEFEEDYESAQIEYLRARDRLGSQVILPNRLNKNNTSTTTWQPQTKFEERIASIIKVTSDEAYQKRLKQINSLTSNLSILDKSVFKQEEAVRYLGELLGFISTRPDNDEGTGPDVLWEDEVTQQCIGFELKTDKKNPANYFKKDISQGHDHLEWISQNSIRKCLGLIYIGNDGKCENNANPSPEMYLCSLSILVDIRNQLVEDIKQIRKIAPAERRANARDF